MLHCSNFRFRLCYLVFTHSFSVISENITVNHTLPKTRFFGLHFCCRQYGSKVDHCDAIGSNGTKFSEITQTNGHYAVHGTNGKPVCDVPCVNSSNVFTSNLALFLRCGGFLLLFLYSIEFHFCGTPNWVILIIIIIVVIYY